MFTGREVSGARPIDQILIGCLHAIGEGRLCTTWLIAAETTSFFDFVVIGLVTNVHEFTVLIDKLYSKRSDGSPVISTDA